MPLLQPMRIKKVPNPNLFYLSTCLYLCFPFLNFFSSLTLTLSFYLYSSSPILPDSDISMKAHMETLRTNLTLFLSLSLNHSLSLPDSDILMKAHIETLRSDLTQANEQEKLTQAKANADMTKLRLELGLRSELGLELGFRLE
jgi:hypothetical protein